MTNVGIYDSDFEQIEKWAEESDTTVAETVADIVECYKVHVLDKE